MLFLPLNPGNTTIPGCYFMRITRGTLLKNARNEAAQRVSQTRRLVCIYLTGSLVTEIPIMGGVTDIDLIIVHSEEPPLQREIVRLTDEVHIDISHYDQDLFRNTRQLRQDAWLGSFVCRDPIVLHDPQHWFDFTQASICAHFMEVENILLRMRPLFEDARQRWLTMSSTPNPESPQTIHDYFIALENAANAVSILSRSVPLTERRFFLHFPERADAIGRPELADDLINMFANQPISDETWQEWTAYWQEAFLDASNQEGFSPRLHPARLQYYSRTADTLRSDYPHGSLWLILRTWTQALCHMPENSPQLQVWRTALKTLSLDEKNFSNRLNALDSYLDNVELITDMWAIDHGIVPLSERV